MSVIINDSSKWKEDVYRIEQMRIGLILKYNLKLFPFKSFSIDNLITQVCKNTICNFVWFLKENEAIGVGI